MKSILRSFLFLLLFSACADQAVQQEFITSDLDNYWTAYDLIRELDDSLAQAKLLDSLFFQKATPGLNGLMAVRRYAPEDYLNSIRNHPQFWASIRSNTENVSKQFEEIETNIQALRKAYPALKPVPVYFTIGNFRSNGTIQDSIILIGCEMALADQSTQVNELPEATQEFYTTYTPINDLPLLSVHEYLHTQQKEVVPNLLSVCIYEGVPEFIACLVTGKPSYIEAFKFADQHLDEVRAKFEEDIFINRRQPNWLWSSNRIFGHRDMGYTVGYYIAKGYYDQASDKQAAIKQLIELEFTDEAAVERIVDQSGFLSKPLENLYANFEASRPTVDSVSGIEQAGRHVATGKQRITIHFSEPLNGYNTGVDFGPLGQEACPKMEDRAWADDAQSWSFMANLEPNKQYQILISNNFRLEDGTPLKPFLIEFWTGE
ncbi:MAG: hypothetical protein AAFV80_13035 [Bacteroidota bacterium]